MSETATTATDKLVKWNIDPVHTEILFKAKHMMISTVSGTFDKYTANIKADPKDLSTAQVEFEADATSINTGNSQRDGHLKSTDFFSAEKNPTVKFKSTRVEKTGNAGEWTMHGDMTINGVTKPIAIEVEEGGIIPGENGTYRAGLSLKGQLSRKEFGMQWNALLESGGAVVGDKVRITGEVELLSEA